MVCLRRSRRKLLYCWLLWILMVLLMLRIFFLMFELGNEDTSVTFFSFLLGPFTSMELDVNKRSAQNFEERYGMDGKRIAVNNQRQSLPGSVLRPAKILHQQFLTRAEIIKQPKNQQQCKVPDLDPFHEDALPFIDYKWRGVSCNIKQKGYVKDSKLILHMKRVQKAGYYYIRFAGEDAHELSEYHTIRKTVFRKFLSQGNDFCLRFSTRKRKDMTVTFFKHNLREYEQQDNKDVKADLAGTASTNQCKDNRRLYFKEDKLYHALTDRCIVPKVSINETILVLSSRPEEECGKDDENLKFSLQDDGTIRHTFTNSCLVFKDLTLFGYFILGRCVNKTVFYVGSDAKRDIKIPDLNVEISLKDDFIRLEYVSDYQLHIEFHMYPLKQIDDYQKSQQVSRDSNKLSILMLMVDSMSRASVQRYMNKTYTMLENDPNSIIMKGHTINGDGTTSQILAMLMGRLEKELPEARKGFPNATYIDSWPFIIREFQEMGYQTLYSEDAPAMNTFNYRLKGFKKKPAVKYLRPWWLEAEQMFTISNRNSYPQKCQHLFMFNYIKQFFTEYRTEKKFLFYSSNIAHNNPKTAVIMDEDVTSMYKFLREGGHLENTIVLLFADHGDRTADFRVTMQGKLEERLPFLSFTFPSWFQKRFRKEFSKFRKNSKVLTTHYDTYTTLKHLQNFPRGVYKHHHGQSLFTDIVRLNRTCQQAGIDSHWCPCLSYKKLNVTNKLVQNMTQAIVKTINNMLGDSLMTKSLCAEVKLGRIISANQRSTNKDVEDFVETAENKDCDECSIVKNKTLKFKKQIFEIIFTALPSQGKFEANVEYNVENAEVTVGEISRINRYGKQPHCIQKDFPYMRKYCYCKDLVIKK